MIVRHRPLFAVLLGSLFWWVAAPARPEIVRWQKVPPSQAFDPEQGELALKCGSLGGYRLKAEEEMEDVVKAQVERRQVGSLDDCAICASGREKPPLYSPLGFDEPADPEGKAARFRSADRIPCAAGSCLERPAEGRAWVAVVDWNGPHGWSVAATVRELLPEEIGVWLEPLRPDDARELDSFSPRGVTDFHLLAALCRIEALANRGVAPLAINLSFGRWPTTTEEPSLAQEIERVIDHLVIERGIPVFAAAGNYRILQFPAAAGRALPVGVLDLEAARRGEVAGTWETPDLPADRPRALLPVSGLCLPVAEEKSWPAPPGSSYATAAFTGLLGSHLAADPNVGTELRIAQTWWLDGRCSGWRCEMVLANDRTVRTGSPAAVRLLGPLLGDEYPECLATVEATARVAAGPAVPLDPKVLSRAEIVPTLKIPSPDSNPCVPCLGAGGNHRPPTARADRVQALEEPWQVDLSAARPLPASTKLKAVQLRIGGEIFPLDLPEETLDALSRAEVPRLTVSGLPWNEVKEGRQPSLRFILAEEGFSYWVSIPLRMIEVRE